MADEIDRDISAMVKDGVVWEIEDQSLSGKAKARLDEKGGKFNLEVGNTGLNIILRKKEGSIFNFMPEGQQSRDPENTRKHTTMLGYGLFSLYQWLGENKAKIEEDGFEAEDLVISSRKTTAQLINALEGLFTRFESEDIVEANREGEEISIDLNKFAELDNNHPLVKYLEKWKERGKGMIVGGYAVKE